jgi:hypothetical protein
METGAPEVTRLVSILFSPAVASVPTLRPMTRFRVREDERKTHGHATTFGWT